MKLGTRLALVLALPILLIVLLFTTIHERQSRALVREEWTRAGRSAPLGAIEVMELESFLEETAVHERRSMAALTIAMVLAARFRDVGSGDLAVQIPVRRRDEIGRLALGFNAMCARLQASQQALAQEQEERRRAEEGLRKAERLASVGQLAAGAAHEIGTPLNVIGGRAEALLRKLEGNAEAERSLRIIVSQTDRITHIVRGILDFARGREPKLVATHVEPVVRSVVELLEIQIEQHGIAVAIDLPSDLPRVIADADRLHQVFLNLAKNAIDAMPLGGKLLVRAERMAPRASGAADVLIVEFRDTGIGIAPENLDRIFDPFFSTKDVGHGTGLGLSVSYGIVREHGGWMDVQSELDRGTTIRVLLPVAAE